jgi:hypothetical protein
MKIKRGLWPDEKVLGVLKSLPPQFIINVDPSDLL